MVGQLPADHRLFRDELFVPFTAVHAVDSLDEALRLSNASVYGLTAGIYSGVEAEVEQFLDQIQTGVLYVNRRAGATTGAWPGVQPFGGWKGSGSTGKAALGSLLRRPVPARAVAHHRRLTRRYGALGAVPGRRSGEP